MDVLQPTDSHGDHASKWMISSHNSNSQMCIACMLQLLEDTTMVAAKKKYVLSEFLSFISANMDAIRHLLQYEQQVACHMCTILFDMTSLQDELFVSLAIEGLVLIACNLKIEEIVCGIVDAVVEQCISDCNYSKSLPGFCIIQKFLNNIEGLSSYLLDNKGAFVDYLCSGIGYPNESVQSCILSILTFLCSSGELPTHVHKVLCREIINILNTSTAVETSISTLRLLKKLISNQPLVITLMATRDEGATLPSSLKKILVSKHVVVQIAATQCVSEIIASNPHYMETLLEADIAEFLYEGLASTNELLLRSIFCCLTLLTDSKIFFTKSHAIYGTDSILRALDQAFKERNPQTVFHGMSLLSTILEKHQCSEVKLLNSAFKVKTCMKLISQGIYHTSHQVIYASCKAMLSYLSVDHIEASVPAEDIKSTVKYLAEKIKHEKLSRHGHLSRSKSNKHHNVRRERCLMVAENLFSILHLMSRLFINNSKKILINEHTFSVPTENDNPAIPDSEDMSNFVAMEMDEACIPFILSNSSEVTKPSTFIHFYQLLNTMIESRCPGVQPLIVKLSQSGIISTTLQIKAKFKNPELNQASCQFLGYLVTDVLESYTKTSPDVTDHIVSGLKHLEGNLDDSIKILHQYTCDTDTTFTAAQHSLIFLLYISFFYDNSPIEVCQLVDGLTAFLSQHDPLPELLIKPTLFLMAICFNDERAWPVNIETAINTLEQALVTRKDDEVWYTHHEAVLQFVFSHPRMQRVCGRNMLEHWIENEASSENTQLEILIANNELCYNSLIDVIINGKHQRSKNAVNIMTSVIEKSSCDWHVEGRSEPLIKILHQVFIDQSAGVSRYNIYGLLEILVLILRQSSEVETASYIKVLYHVFSLLENEIEDDIISVTNFLTCLLSCDMKQKSTTVSSLMIGRCDLLAKLESWHQSNDFTRQTCAINLLASLLKLQTKHSIQVQRCVKIHVEILFFLLKSKHYSSVLSTIKLWTAIFESHPTSGFVTLDSRNMESTSEGCVLSTQEVRRLLIHLQQHIIKIEPVIKDAAVECFVAMYESLKTTNYNVALHVLDQPWNRYLLSTCIQWHEQWPRWLWKIVHVILSNDDVTMLTDADLESLLQYLVENEDTENLYYKMEIAKKLLTKSCSETNKAALQAKFDLHVKRGQLVTQYKLIDIDGIVFCVEKETASPQLLLSLSML